MTDTEAALAGWRQRALDAEGLVDTYRARVGELERSLEELGKAAGAVLEVADVLASECRRVTPELYEQEITGYETMRAALLSMLL